MVASQFIANCCLLRRLANNIRKLTQYRKINFAKAVWQTCCNWQTFLSVNNCKWNYLFRCKVTTSPKNVNHTSSLSCHGVQLKADYKSLCLHFIMLSWYTFIKSNRSKCYTTDIPYNSFSIIETQFSSDGFGRFVITPYTSLTFCSSKALQWYVTTWW